MHIFCIILRYMVLTQSELLQIQIHFVYCSLACFYFLRLKCLWVGTEWVYVQQPPPQQQAGADYCIILVYTLCRTCNSSFINYLYKTCSADSFFLLRSCY